MQWTEEAEAAIKKVPFFVRKRVKTRVEKEAAEADKKTVALADVKATQKRYLTNMKSEVKGYQLDTCFGPGGCPHRANQSEELLEKIEALLKKENLLGFLEKRVKSDLKFHHEFRVTLADCPNSCSQPQIKDIGIIGACTPAVTDETCTQCEACVDACREEAITLAVDNNCPKIDDTRCLHCGKCIPVCPTGTIIESRKAYRVQVGGKLGRHPRLARELPGIYSETQVLTILKDCIRFYKQNSQHGQRFAEIFTESDFHDLAARIAE